MALVVVPVLEAEAFPAEDSVAVAVVADKKTLTDIINCDNDLRNKGV